MVTERRGAIINPSNPYSISLADSDAACAAVLIVSQGAYGIAADGEVILPICLCGGLPEPEINRLCSIELSRIANYLDLPLSKVQRIVSEFAIGGLVEENRLGLLIVSPPQFAQR